MVVVMQSRAVLKMRIGKSQFFCFLVHHGHKTFFRSADCSRQCLTCICAGWKQHTIEKITNRRLFVRIKSRYRRILCRQFLEDVLRNRNRLVQIRKIFNGKQRCHNLCHRRRINSLISAQIHHLSQIAFPHQQGMLTVQTI